MHCGGGFVEKKRLQEKVKTKLFNIYILSSEKIFSVFYGLKSNFIGSMLNN